MNRSLLRSLAEHADLGDLSTMNTHSVAARKRREKRKQRKRERIDLTATAFKLHHRNGEAYLVDVRTALLLDVTDQSVRFRDQRSRRRSKRHDRRLAVAIEDEHFSAVDLFKQPQQ